MVVGELDGLVVGVGGGVGVFVMVGDVVELVVGLEDDVELGDGVGVEGFDKIQSLLLSIVQL